MAKKWNAKSELCLIVTEETLEGEIDMKENELNFLTISVKRIFQFLTPTYLLLN
jgi:hypothetical protein